MIDESKIGTYRIGEELMRAGNTYSIVEKACLIPSGLEGRAHIRWVNHTYRLTNQWRYQSVQELTDALDELGVDYEYK